MNLRKAGIGAAASALLGSAALVAAAAPASADYGPGAVYQIEISSNLTGPQGGGVWLWLGLYPSAGSTTSGTGDYAGSDCGHGFGQGPGSSGAAKDQGDVTWSVSGKTLTISGVVLNGLDGLPVTITVPSAYGHYSEDVVSVFPTLGPVLGLPSGAGFSQVQVAP